MIYSSLANRTSHLFDLWDTRRERKHNFGTCSCPRLLYRTSGTKLEISQLHLWVIEDTIWSNIKLNYAEIRYKISVDGRLGQDRLCLSVSIESCQNETMDVVNPNWLPVKPQCLVCCPCGKKIVSHIQTLAQTGLTRCFLAQYIPHQLGKRQNHQVGWKTSFHAG